MITGRKSIAKVSGSPGKTRTINHFLVQSAIAPGHEQSAWYLVDLPGYGYARLAKTEREKIDTMIWQYLSRRKSLVCTFVLIDARLEPQKIDLDFINRMGEMDIPFIILFTKADKLAKSRLAASVSRFLAHLARSWEEPPPWIITSSANGTGRPEMLRRIGEILSQA